VQAKHRPSSDDKSIPGRHLEAYDRRRIPTTGCMTPTILKEDPSLHHSNLLTMPLDSFLGGGAAVVPGCFSTSS
jgi:hypothetical protein